MANGYHQLKNIKLNTLMDMITKHFLNYSKHNKIFKIRCYLYMITLNGDEELLIRDPSLWKDIHVTKYIDFYLFPLFV